MSRCVCICVRANLNKSIVLLVAAVLSATSFFVFMVESIQVGYYSESDMLGPISEFPLFYLIISFLLALLMILVLKSRKVNPIILFVPLLILVLIKYVLPDLIDRFYATNFYDAPGHLTRGLFVAKTGHSDPTVDGYFDLQPSFFWTTAIILNIVCGIPSSIVSPPSLFLIKWFHILAIALYVPILYILYKKLLGKTSLICLALILQFGMDIGHYHYAAQSYGNVLYWLSLALALTLARKVDRKITTLLLVLGLNLIFLHQGLTLFLVVLLVTMLFYPLPFKISRSKSGFLSKKFWIPLTTLVIVWFSYLMFITIYTFEDFVITFRNVIESLVGENVNLISAGISRPNAYWMQIVTYKAVYIALLVLLGIILSFMNASKSHDDVDKAVFNIQLFTATIIGPIAIALGGTAYIERLFLILPLIIYSLIKFTFNTKWSFHYIKKLIYALATVGLILLLFSGTSFYFSGRNFQSLTYSEVIQRNFLISHDPNNVKGLYTNMLVSPVSSMLTYGFEHGHLYVISTHDTIYGVYYIVGESSEMLKISIDLYEQNDLIYDNMIVKIVKS